MAKVTIKGFICAQKYSWSDEVTYRFYSNEATDHGYVTVAPYTIEFEAPDDFNFVAAQVHALTVEEERLRNDFNRRIAQINQQKSKLQAIEFTPAEA